MLLTVLAGSGYGVGAPASASGSIADNDASALQPTITVAATDAAGSETAPNTITFVITRGTVTTGALTLNLSWSGLAGYGTDYAVVASSGTLAPDGSTLTLADGQTSATLTLTPVDDLAVEGAESVVLAIVSGAGYAVGSPGSATASIADNDVAALPTLTATATDANGSETAPNTITFVLTRATATGTAFMANLQWAGTAGYGTDYTVSASAGTLAANGSTLTFAVGQITATLTLTPIDDVAVEGTESVLLTVMAGAGYTVGSPSAASGSIADNDVPQLYVDDLTVVEGDKNTSLALITVRLSAISTTPISVTLSTVAGTALATKDFTATTTTLTFNPGVVQLTFQVKIVGDKVKEATEAFTVVLSGPVGATIADGSATITIVDNDAALMAASVAPAGTQAPQITAAQAAPVLSAAIGLWAAQGLDVLALRGLHLVIADACPAAGPLERRRALVEDEVRAVALTDVA